MTISHLAQALALVGTISAGTYAWHDLSTQVANNSRDIAMQQYTFFVRLKQIKTLTPEECAAFLMAAKRLGIPAACR